MKPVAFIFALFAPIIFWISGADKNSFSLYWGTIAEPWFILTVASCSFYMFQSKNWKMPAVFALLLTAFNAYQWATIHNVTAVLFFITCFVSILNGTKKLRFYAVLYLVSVIGFLWSCFLVEVLMTYVLIAYHLHLYMLEQKVNKIEYLK